MMTVSAEYRDDPSSPDGLCTAHQVIPATWRILLPSGAEITVPNADPHAAGHAFGPGGALLTCRGELNGGPPVQVGLTGG